MSIIRAKLDVTKILKEHIFAGAKGKYIDITLLENKNGRDQYDNDFMVVQDIGKEARERGEKGPILGNAKYMGERPAAPTAGNYRRAEKPAEPKPAPLDEDVPF